MSLAFTRLKVHVCGSNMSNENLRLQALSYSTGMTCTIVVLTGSCWIGLGSNPAGIEFQYQC